MTIAAPPSGLQPEDYDAIEAAVLETARGRWFLSEYGRRARTSEAERLLTAMTRIEARLDALGAPPNVQAVPIIERLEKLVWTLRESGVEDFVCAKVEALARDLAWGGMIVEESAAPAKETPRETAVAPPPVIESPTTAPVSLDEQAPAKASLRFAHEAEPVLDTPNLLAHKASLAFDARLDALLWLDRLPLLDRMALFA